MDNDEKKFVCLNMGCEHFYDSTKKTFAATEVNTSVDDEPCCPGCNQQLMDLKLKIEIDEREGSVRKRKLIKTGGIILSIIAVIVLTVFLAKKITSSRSGVENEIVEDYQLVEDQVTFEPEVIKEPAKEPVKPANTSTGSQTKTFSNGDRYVGEMKSGKMHGLGTYYYASGQLISSKDLKKRMAEAGDYLIGEFYEGNVVSGKLYDSKNNVKEVVMIGR